MVRLLGVALRILRWNILQLQLQLQLLAALQTQILQYIQAHARVQWAIVLIAWHGCKWECGVEVVVGLLALENFENMDYLKEKCILFFANFSLSVFANFVAFYNIYGQLLAGFMACVGSYGFSLRFWQKSLPTVCKLNGFCGVSCFVPVVLVFLTARGAGHALAIVGCGLVFFVVLLFMWLLFCFFKYNILAYNYCCNYNCHWVHSHIYVYI